MLKSNYFTIELHYRNRLQFVKEIADFETIAKIETKIRAQKGWGDKGEGVYKVFFCYVSTTRHQIAEGRYPHLSETVINGQRRIGFDELKLLIMKA